MDTNKYKQIGNNVIDEVTSAINSGNYNGLGSRLGQQLDQASNQFVMDMRQMRAEAAQRQAAARYAAEEYYKNHGGKGGRAMPSPPPYVTREMRPKQSMMPTPPPMVRPARGNINVPPASIPGEPRNYFLLKPVSDKKGIAEIVMGALAWCFVLVEVVGDIMANGFAFDGVISFFMLLVAALGTFLIYRGVTLHNLMRLYYDYGKVVGTSEFVPIDEFAEEVDVRPETLRGQFTAMQKNKFLPMAQMDVQGQVLLLTSGAYEKYMAFRNSQAEMEARSIAYEEENTSADLKKIIEKGNDFLKWVRDANDMIPDEEMSRKLFRLENIMHKIFDQVKKDPSAVDQLDRLLEYYLPTTEKLLEAYIQLDKQPDHIENVEKSKQEIRGALDVINDAFEKLLDSLFQDMAWDISSDINVMKTMFAQDGLTENIREQRAGETEKEPEYETILKF